MRCAIPFSFAKRVLMHTLSDSVRLLVNNNEFLPGIFHDFDNSKIIALILVNVLLAKFWRFQFILWKDTLFV